MTDLDTPWGLTEEELGLVGLVRDEVWHWRLACREPGDLLGLWALTASLDRLLAGKTPDAAVSVSLSHVDGDNRASVSVDLDQDTLELGESTYFYDPTIGGDRESRVNARFGEGIVPREAGVYDWLDTCAELRRMANSMDTEIIEFPEM